MNRLFSVHFDEVRKVENFNEFYKLAKEVNPDLDKEQFRATITDGSLRNWPYSGTKFCKVCQNAVNTPYFYQMGVTPKEYWQEDGQTPKHDCIPAVVDPVTGKLKNASGMPVADEHIILDPVIP